MQLDWSARGAVGERDDKTQRGDAPAPFEVLWTPEPLPQEPEARGTPRTESNTELGPPTSEYPRSQRHRFPAISLLLAGVALGAGATWLALQGGEEVLAQQPDHVAEALRSDLARSTIERDSLLRERTELQLRIAEQEQVRIAQERVAGEESARVARELEQAATRKVELETAVVSAEARIAELEGALAQREPSVTDEERAARIFDSGCRAASEMKVAEVRESARGLVALGLGGASWCDELTETLDAFARFDASLKSGPIDVGALRRATELLESVRTERPDKSATPLAWWSAGADAAERAAIVEATVAALAARFDAAVTVLRAADDADWARCSKGWSALDSTAALEHSATFGCAHIAELAPKLVPELRRTLFKFRQLDLALLRDVKGLSEWAERLRSGSIALDGGARGDLELLAFAQRWLDDKPGNEVPPDWSRIEQVPPAGEHGDWRRELELLWRLSQPDSGFPVRDNGLRLYRTVDAQGRVEWSRELALSARDGAWRIQRDRLAGDGRTELESVTLRIERRDGEFVLASSGETLLDLRMLGPTTRVAVFPLHLDTALPDAFGIDADSLMEFRSFRPVCLIHASAGVRRWFEPRWGLVREEVQTTRGLEVRELVFAR